MGSTGEDSAPAHCACSSGGIAELFNDYFSSIVSGSDPPVTTLLLHPIARLHPSTADSFSRRCPSCSPKPRYEQSYWSRRNTTENTNECAHRNDRIALSLCLLFNHSIQLGSLPSLLAAWNFQGGIPGGKQATPYPTNGNWLTSYLSTKKVIRLTSKIIFQSPFFVISKVLKVC